jgi:PatG C-terminal
MSLTSMEVRLWGLSVSRRVVEVVFTFTQRKNEFVEKYFVRVDVNDEFPFLVSKIAAYFDH